MSVFESLLNNTFAVARRTRTGDGQGGWVVGYVAVGSVAGRIRPASSAEREVAAREERELSHVLYLVATGANVERGDRVVCGGLEVEVLGIREPSRAGHHLEIDCQERQFEVAITYPGFYWPTRFWPARSWPGRFWVAA